MARPNARGVRKKPGNRIPRNQGPRIPCASNGPEATNLLIHQTVFVNHLLGDARFNWELAAEMTGFADPKQIAIDYKKHPGILAAIKARLDKGGMSTEELIAREVEVARANPMDFMSRRSNGTWYVDLVKVHRLGKGHLIRKIKATRWGLDVELQSQSAARERLERMRGLFQDRLNVVHTIDYSKLPDHPAVIPLLERRGRGEIDDQEFQQHLLALGYNPSPAPTLIEGQGRVHEVSDEDGGSDPDPE